MKTTIFDGEQYVKTHIEDLKKDILLKHATLCFVGFKGQRASVSYLKKIRSMAFELGIVLKEIFLEENISQNEFETIIEKINKDEFINGILVDFPLPSHLNNEWLRKNIDPNKDVDAVSYIRKGMMFSSGIVAPSTAKAVYHIILENNLLEHGKNVVIINRTEIVGLPLHLMLTKKGIDCTVTMCHSKTPDLKEHTKKADIVITAIGKPHYITRDYLKENGVIIDVGVSELVENNKKKFVGDIDYNNLIGYSSFVTPTPGGVGPVTTYMLFDNLSKLIQSK